ncbi:hypothetical protein [Ralstonia pseudosolanacearum]|uniref:hypothetical protein n=1 Tax=Ralstonia pseudosolanacearum TaxID=1310165 RepID=UPI0018D00B63|nr:hypothetical protein [Ralstonia pseudosolanacearum]
MRELLGADIRIPMGTRVIRLSSALGRGIDAWVFASADSIRSHLRSGKSTMTGLSYKRGMLSFFEYLTGESKSADFAKSKPRTPADLSPLHISQFIEWLKNSGSGQDVAVSTPRGLYVGVKAVLEEMFTLGIIEGERHRFFKRGAFKRDSGESRHTSFSDAEQERLSAAIKSDLAAIHHGRLTVTMREVQALRLLVVAHRMGPNTTPLLEITRDAMKPGLLPGTIVVETTKYRSRRLASQVGRAAPTAAAAEVAHEEVDGSYLLPFNFAEGAVIQQAIDATEHLVHIAPASIRNRVWLYVVSHNAGKGARKGDITCLTTSTLFASIQTIVKRHKLVGDDGKPLKVNSSRFRKSRFDRAFRVADGDLFVTANLMGNTPVVAGTNYPSMNMSRQAEAAGFMNEDYVANMRMATRDGTSQGKDVGIDGKGDALRVVEIKPVDHVQTQTPVSGCSDAFSGEYAPRNGRPCDRFVMCLFCSSFAIVGTEDELWRLFSFQVFARVELEYLDESLGHLPSSDGPLEDLRDRYRLAIPYIDSFTHRQFAASRVAAARAKTAAGLHLFWQLQMQISRRARRAVSQPIGQSANESGAASITDQDLIMNQSDRDDRYGT